MSYGLRLDSQEIYTAWKCKGQKEDKKAPPPRLDHNSILQSSATPGHVKASPKQRGTEGDGEGQAGGGMKWKCGARNNKQTSDQKKQRF